MPCCILTLVTWVRIMGQREVLNTKCSSESLCSKIWTSHCCSLLGCTVGTLPVPLSMQYNWERDTTSRKQSQAFNSCWLLGQICGFIWAGNGLWKIPPHHPTQKIVEYTKMLNRFHLSCPFLLGVRNCLKHWIMKLNKEKRLWDLEMVHAIGVGIRNICLPDSDKP